MATDERAATHEARLHMHEQTYWTASDWTFAVWLCDRLSPPQNHSHLAACRDTGQDASDGRASRMASFGFSFSNA